MLEWLGINIFQRFMTLSTSEVVTIGPPMLVHIVQYALITEQNALLIFEEPFIGMGFEKNRFILLNNSLQFFMLPVS